MSGASEQTQRVMYLNANWTPAPAGGADGDFALLIVTEDDERHTVHLSAAAATAVVAMARAGTVLLWDGTNRSLIVATWWASGWRRTGPPLFAPPARTDASALLTRAIRHPKRAGGCGRCCPPEVPAAARVRRAAAPSGGSASRPAAMPTRSELSLHVSRRRRPMKGLSTEAARG
jgi:hypothetical protein